MQTCIGMMQLQGWDCGSFSVPAYLPRSVRSMEMQKVRRGACGGRGCAPEGIFNGFLSSRQRGNSGRGGPGKNSFSMPTLFCLLVYFIQHVFCFYIVCVFYIMPFKGHRRHPVELGASSCWPTPAPREAVWEPPDCSRFPPIMPDGGI
jgi:hypothetical protein